MTESNLQNLKINVNLIGTFVRKLIPVQCAKRTGGDSIRGMRQRIREHFGIKTPSYWYHLCRF